MTNIPRKRFQIHLSTAIVMMFVAGMLLYMNFAFPRIEKSPVLQQSDPLTNVWFHAGWPAEAFVYWPSGRYLGDDLPAGISIKNYGAAAIDLGLCFANLVATWFLCEWLIRRRAPKMKT